MIRYPTFFILIIALGCVDNPQDIPPSLKSNPVFYTELNPGTSALRLTAGENGYAMKTDHFVDGEGVTHYISTLSSESCDTKPCPALEMEFYDHQVISHPESGVGFTFVNGSKGYYSAETDDALSITFFLAQVGTGPNVSFWTTAGDTTPLTTNEIHLTAQPDEYLDLCFHRLNNIDCSGSSLFCFHTLASSPFIGFLKARHTAGDYYLIEMELQGNAPFNYKWMNGSSAPSILMEAAEGQEFNVGLTVTDATGSEIEIEQTMHVLESTALMCGGTPQFVYSIADAPFTQFSTAIVRYTDENGILFSSEYGPQMGNATFEILSVTDYEESPEGYATKQLEIALVAKLYTADGSQMLSLSSSNTVVAIAYE